MKFDENTTIIGWISNNDETSYQEEIPFSVVIPGALSPEKSS